MKTRILFTTMLILLAGFIYAQTCTLKWTQNNGKSGSSRTETFDFEWGRLDKGAQSPYKLAIQVDGKLLTGSKALTELRKPIWGDGTQTFNDILPVVPRSVPQYISRNQYPWFSVSDTLPQGEAVKGYECRITDGKIFQGMTYQTVPWWNAMGVVDWRPWNPTQGGNQQIFKEPNPQYEIVEAQKQAALTEWERIISETFVQVADYIFPSFKYGKNVKWFMKCEDDPDWLEFPVDKNNPLWSSHGGWIRHQQKVRDSDMKPWRAFYANSAYLSGEARVKKLLGLK